MLRNVVQTFLRDPVETQRYFEGNGFRDVAMRKLEWDSVQFQEVGTVGFKRRYQAEMVKGRGVKMVSRPAEVIREFLHPFAKRSELFAEQTGGSGWSLFQRGHLVCQHGHSLVHVVVKLSRHAFALLFLSREELRHQSPELVLASAQGILGELARGDVDTGTDDLLDRAVGATAGDA
jgi:hypothetical protein